MKFELTQTYLSSTPAEVVAAYTDPGLYATFEGLTKVAPPEVVAREVTGDHVSLTLRMRFVADPDHPARDAISPHWLDLVIVPLVGFDARGHRLGMGAGLYDRQFAFLRHRRTWRRPLLVGVAFEAQRLPRLAEAAHDVQLHGVVTEHGVYGSVADR